VGAACQRDEQSEVKNESSVFHFVFPNS
jgi:hypothetical protein